MVSSRNHDEELQLFAVLLPMRGACPGKKESMAVSQIDTLTVSGQNTIGIYITPLVFIQPTDVKQNAVNNNWLLKLQPAVKLKSWQNSNFHLIE